MNAPSRMGGPVKTILLATDLSASCDRALSRAAMLAKERQSALIVLHVIEDRDPTIQHTVGLPSWRRPLDPSDLARRHLLADVDTLPVRPTLLIAEGNPADAILNVAETENCDLVAIGLERNKTLRHFIFSGTTDRLLNRSRIPVVVVKDRPRRPYRNIVFATDLSASSRHALEVTARLFPGQRLTVFHAHQSPAGLITESASQRQNRVDIELEMQNFLKGMDNSSPGWQRPHVLIEDGTPNFLLRDYARDMEVDLLVVGAHDRSAIAEIFVGNMTKTIMNEAPCDTLTIREPHPHATRDQREPGTAVSTGGGSPTIA